MRLDGTDIFTILPSFKKIGCGKTDECDDEYNIFHSLNRTIAGREYQHHPDKKHN